MDVPFTPEQEVQLAALARHTGRAPEEVVKDAISNMLNARAHFVASVKEGLSALDRGEFVTHEEVGARLERLLQD